MRRSVLAVAYSIAHSPLVKTALFASDPELGPTGDGGGSGRGGPAWTRQQVDLFLDDVCIVRGGQRAAEYREADGQRVFDQDEITIRVNLGRGEV